MTKNNIPAPQNDILFNINDLPSAAPQLGSDEILFNVNEMPDATNIKIYDNETSKGIETSQGMDDIETNYRINTDVKNIPAQKHLAATPIDDSNDSSFFVDAFNFTKKLANGELVREAVKGAKSSVQSTPQLFGSFLKQIAGDPNKPTRDILSDKGFSALETTIDYPVEQNQELDDYANKMILKNQQRLEASGLVRPTEAGANKFFFDLGSSVPNLIAALGVTSIVKNPLPAATLFGEIQKDQIYLEARQKGLNHQEAMATAVPAGLAEGGIEIIGLDRFFKIGKGDKFISKVVKRSAVEGVQEASQQLAEDTITDIGNVRNTTTKEKFENSMYSGLIGLVLGAPAAVVTSSLEKKSPEIPSEKLKKGVDDLVESGAVDRMKNLLKKETDEFLENPEVESKIVADLKEATKEVSSQQNLAGVLSKIQGSRRSTATDDLVQSTKDTTKKEIKELRIRNLEDNISSLDNQISILGDLIDSKKQRDEDVSTDEKKLNSLVNKRDSLDEQFANILSTQINDKETSIKNIDKEIERTNQKIENLSFSIKDKEFKNKKVKTDKEKLERLLRKLYSLEEDRENILATPLKKYEKYPELEKFKELDPYDPNSFIPEKKEAEPNVDVIRNLRDNAIRDINASFRKGRSLAKKDVTEAQNFITNIIDQSGIAAADKAKFIRTIKNIKDANALTEKLPEIQSRISNLVEAASRRQLKADIKSALSKTKTKKQSGKPVGKFGAETQKILDRLRKVSKLSVKDAQDILNTRNPISSELTKPGQLPSYEEAIENSILSSIASDINISDLEKLKSQIDTLIAEGKEGRKNELFVKIQEVANIQSSINELVTQGQNLQLKDKTFVNSIFEALSDVNNSFMNYDWNNILDIILPPSKNNPQLKTSIIDKMSITKLVQKEKGIIRIWAEQFNTEAKKAFGIINNADLSEKFYQDSREKIIGNFIDSAGKEVRLKYSKSQARKFYMEFQDDSLKKVIQNEKIMAYTPEMVEAVINQLDNKDIAFAKAQLSLYEKFYPQINEIYSRVYGTYLPNRNNYSPTAREVNKDYEIGTSEFMQEVAFRSIIDSGSFITRVENLNGLRRQSDIAVFQRHIAEMAHFISMGEKLQQIQQVFSNKDLRKNIDAAYGNGMLELIDETIESMVKNGAIKSNSLDRVINGLNRTFAFSKLGGKIALAPKQLTSMLAYWEDMSTKDFINGLVDFAKNPKKAIETLNQSELVKARGIPEVDLSRLGKTTEAQKKFGQLFRKTKKIQDLLLLPIKFGDKGAILVGGWAYYKNQIQQGKTAKKALEAFEEITARTQQSVDVDRLGRLQRGNAIARGLSMFITSPNAFLKQEVTAIRKFKRGEITGKELGKKIFLYHFALPAVFQFVANAFTFDKEDQLAAIITGPLTGYFILGELISNALRSLVSDDKFRLGGYKFLMGFEDIFNGIVDAANNFGDTEEMLDASVEVMKGAGTLTGFPIDEAKNISEGINDIGDGVPIRGSARILGYSKKSVEEIDN